MKIYKGKWWVAFEIERYPTTLISFGINVPKDLFEKVDAENKRRKITNN